MPLPIGNISTKSSDIAANTVLYDWTCTQNMYHQCIFTDMNQKILEVIMALLNSVSSPKFQSLINMILRSYLWAYLFLLLRP